MDLQSLLETCVDDSTQLLSAPFFQSDYEDKASILQQLDVAFCTPNDNQKIQKISFKHDNSTLSQHGGVEVNDQSRYGKRISQKCSVSENSLLQHVQDSSSSNHVSPQPRIMHIAGILLYDLVSNSQWWHGVVSSDDAKQLLLFKHLISASFEGRYQLKNLQARILSQILIYRYPNVWDGQLEQLAENIQNGESSDQIEVALRTLLFFMQSIEDQKQVKQFHQFVPKLLPALLSAFMNDELVDAHDREQILEILYYCLRTVSWADGIENEIVDECLSETFNNWMSLFLQVIQTNPRSYFDIKKSALKCLTVIFRDYINYSRECLGMILKPAWKLLNFHVPVFTEIIGYNANMSELAQTDEQSAQDQYERGFESEEEQSETSSFGVESMTQNLIELLTTLVQRQNLHEVVRQGLLPLVSTVASYMILPYNRERYHYGDYNYFIHDKDEDIYKQCSIRNSCLDLLSSLIEVFGDEAVMAIVNVVELLFQQPTPINAEDKVSTSDTSSTVSSAKPSPTLEDINIFEYTYLSPKKKHQWKRREVALYILGSFAEDLSMFRIRNPQFDLRKLVTEALVNWHTFEKASLKSCLKGRTLWCATQLVEILPFDFEDIHIVVLKNATDVLLKEDIISLKLVATRVLIKFSRKLKPEVLQVMIGEVFEPIIDELARLLDNASLDTLHLPIEAFTQYSRLNEDIVARMAPKITPKLLTFFKAFHHESSITQELLSLFKLWCQYEACRSIFVNTFVPFIMEIVDMYYRSTPNAENKDQLLLPQAKTDAVDQTAPKQQLMDASILTHVLDLLCTLLKRAKDKTSAEFGKIMDLFPKLLDYVHKSDDMFLLLNGTSTLRTFLHLGHTEVLKRSTPKDIIDVAKKLLLPSTNENAAIALGNFVIQIFHKVQPQIDTALLMSVVWKIYKSRMPSIVQSLVLVFARLIHSHAREILEFLSETSIDNRICLKIVLDKWLLQQPLFRGYYTKNATLSALLKIFLLRDPRVENLMVIGYNPSHSNVNSEVNAPFKILSLLMRYLDNELNPKKTAHNRVRGPGKEEEKTGGSLMAGYKMKRDNLGDGERLDTIDQNDDDDDYQPPSKLEYQDDDDENNDSLPREDDDEAALDSDEEEALRKKRAGAERIEVNLDDLKDDDENESLLKQGLFAVKESQDRGLADMETGSEVYMSELLAGFDMEDFEEAEEQNEEDLMELGDSFGSINLRNHVQDELANFLSKDKTGYIPYCVRQLTHEDQELAKKYIRGLTEAAKHQ